MTTASTITPELLDQLLANYESCVLGAWLMLSRMTFATAGAIADKDHVIGALVITVAICAMAEVARPLRLAEGTRLRWVRSIETLICTACVIGGLRALTDAPLPGLARRCFQRRLSVSPPPRADHENLRH